MLGAALPTGSAVLYKPSELTPCSGAALGELLQEAGVPEGVFSVLQGGAEVGAPLATSGAMGVFFTGSVRAGRAAVVPGWDLALLRMRVGEEAALELPPSLAYGAKGNAKVTRARARARTPTLTPT